MDVTQTQRTHLRAQTRTQAAADKAATHRAVWMPSNAQSANRSVAGATATTACWPAENELRCASTKRLGDH